MKHEAKVTGLSREQAQLFSAVITAEKIRAAIAAHPAEYANFIAAEENAAKKQAEVDAAKRRRTSRKGAS